MIDRRELLNRAAMLLGGALSSSAALGVLSGCVAIPDTTATAAPTAPLRFLTAAEMQTVSAMSEQIIPRTDTPGATDLGVPAFIDRMMAEFYRQRPRDILRAGLARADLDSQAAHGKRFADVSAEQQVSLMRVYDREAFDQNRRTLGVADADQHFFRIMKELTTLGVFTTEFGSTKLLRYESVPGPYRADVPLSEVGRTWAT